MRCQHCSKEFGLARFGRGLCKTCHASEQIRLMYPSRPCGPKPKKAAIRCQCPTVHNRRKASESEPDDITEEALDALIAAQLPTMPGQNRRAGERLLGTLPRAISFGRGIDSSKFRAKPRRGNW